MSNLMSDIHIQAIICRLDTATNAFITSPFLRATYQPIHTIRVGFCCSTNRFEALKDTNKDQTAMPTTISKREKFRLMLRDYGGTLLAFHITISLISLGGCYMLVIRSVDCFTKSFRNRILSFN